MQPRELRGSREIPRDSVSGVYCRMQHATRLVMGQSEVSIGGLVDLRGFCGVPQTALRKTITSSICWLLK